MDLRDVVSALRGDLSLKQFGEQIGVSPTAVADWEAGKKVGPWNRVRLLAYAKAHKAPAKIVKDLERAQPDAEVTRP